MKRLKVLYLCGDLGIPVLGFKGASVHVREMTRALVAMGHEVHVLCAKLGSGNDLPGLRLIEAAPTADVSALTGEVREIYRLASSRSAAEDALAAALARDLRGLAYSRQLLPALEGLIDEVQPDVVYERYALFIYAGARAAQARGVPRILEVNAPLIAEQRKARGLQLADLAETTEGEIFRSADALIAVSQEVRDHIVSRGVPAERVTVLPNGVDPVRFQPSAGREAGRALRAQYGLDGKCVVGFVGSLKPWHGIDVLIAAFARAREQRADLHLLIAGDGPMREALETLVGTHGLAGAVTFTGALPHDAVPAHLAVTDIAAAPYRSSGPFYFSPLKVVEYMAMGTAVVASRLGQVCQVIEDGKHGLLCAPDDPGDLAACIVRLANAPPLRRALGRAAAGRVRSDYTWARAAEQVAKLARALGRGAVQSFPETAPEAGIAR